MVTNDLAIGVDAIEKTFRSGMIRRTEVKALRGVSFSVKRGAIFGLLGPNGAGKTTLIKILLGLVSPTGGKAELLGRHSGDLVSRRSVGYLPEHHRIPGHLSGETALYYYGGLSGMSPSEVKQKKDALLSRVGLSEFSRMSVTQYSKGMLQRLGLAQALLHEPELLILDEPTDGVDPVGRREMRTLLQELKSEGKTIFINSHLLQEVELVCDRVAMLVKGELRREGTVEEFTTKKQPDVNFVVVAEEAALKKALGKLVSSPFLKEGDVTRFQLSSPEKSDVNHCVDLLRQNHIDIVSIAPLRDSLEDAFLDVVQGEVV